MGATRPDVAGGTAQLHRQHPGSVGDLFRHVDLKMPQHPAPLLLPEPERGEGCIAEQPPAGIKDLFQGCIRGQGLTEKERCAQVHGRAIALLAERVKQKPEVALSGFFAMIQAPFRA